MAEIMAAHHALSFDDPWSAESFARMLGMPGTYGYLAAEGDEVVGFILMRALADEAEILTIAVDPNHRRKSIGRILLDESILEARTRGASEMFLEVAQNNDAALALYTACGFTQMGRRAGYYRQAGRSVDALTLRRNLSSSLSS